MGECIDWASQLNVREPRQQENVNIRSWKKRRGQINQKKAEAENRKLTQAHVPPPRPPILSASRHYHTVGFNSWPMEVLDAMQSEWSGIRQSSCDWRWISANASLLSC